MLEKMHIGQKVAKSRLQENSSEMKLLETANQDLKDDIERLRSRIAMLEIRSATAEMKIGNENGEILKFGFSPELQETVKFDKVETFEAGTLKQGKSKNKRKLRIHRKSKKEETDDVDVPEFRPNKEW